jgi:hypothetical protein
MMVTSSFFCTFAVCYSAFDKSALSTMSGNDFRIQQLNDSIINETAFKTMD